MPGSAAGLVRRVAGQACGFAVNPLHNARDITVADQFKVAFTVTLLAPSK